MDLTGAIRLIQETAVKATAATPLRLTADGRVVHVAQNGGLTPINMGPPIRNHFVESLDDLILFAGRAAECTPKTCPILWHDEPGVVLILDDGDRRDTVTFRLAPTRQLSTLLKLEVSPPALQQREFIRLLRIDLAQPPALVAQFRRLDWRNTADASGVVDHGRESLGRRVEASVGGSADIPEEFTLTIPLYEKFGEDDLYNIRCALDFDVLNAAITIQPVAGELARAIALHQRSIRSRLDAALDGSDGRPEVPIYYGTP